MQELSQEQLEMLEGGAFPLAVIAGLKWVSTWGGIAGIAAFGLSQIP